RAGRDPVLCARGGLRDHADDRGGRARGGALQPPGPGGALGAAASAEASGRARGRRRGAGRPSGWGPVVSGRYAQTTTVDPTASRAEIERLLRRYGATAFASSWDDDTNVAVIGFKMRGRGVRFTLPLPKRTEFAR